MVSFKAKALKAAIILLVLTSRTAECVRCYECSSQTLRNCGDPFFPANVPAIECGNLATSPVHMCYKAIQFVGGQYVTVRGCSPFNSEVFNPGLQRAMGGTYWKGGNAFSICDYDNCNSANVYKFNLNLVFITLALAILPSFF